MTTHSPGPALAGTVNGESIRSLLAAFHSLPLVQALLVAHGLPADPQPGHWYPVAAWLAVLADVEARFGAATVYAAGLQVVEQSVWPPDLATLPQALAALAAAHRLNVRGPHPGTYRLDALGPRAWRVHCATPAPAAFEQGLLTGLARKFKPADALRVRVEAETPVAGRPPGEKRFRLSW